MSAIICGALTSLVVGWWLSKRGYDDVEISLVSFAVFIAIFWTVFGAGLLSKSENYDYALGYQGLVVALTQEGELQVGVSLVNVGPSAIKYEVRDFHVVIDDRTLVKPAYDNKGGVIPRMIGRVYRYDYFRADTVKDYIGKSTKGLIEFAIDYGPYNGRPQRTLKMKLNTTFNLIYPPQVVDTILEEKETKYVEENETKDNDK